jgi:hypothetical protein
VQEIVEIVEDHVGSLHPFTNFPDEGEMEADGCTEVLGFTDKKNFAWENEKLGEMREEMREMEMDVDSEGMGEEEEDEEKEEEDELSESLESPGFGSGDRILITGSLGSICLIVQEAPPLHFSRYKSKIDVHTSAVQYKQITNIHMSSHGQKLKEGIYSSPTVLSTA